MPLLIVSLFVSCAHREGDPDDRLSPYDPGSDRWTENALPVLSVNADSLWYDFNHTKATGTIKIHLQEDDLNFPYDTLVGSLFYNGIEIKLPQAASKRDTSLLISGIKPATAAQCTVTVYDIKHSASSRSVKISIPDSIPAMPPKARITNGSGQVTLTWTPTPGISYVVYYSDSLKGPYCDSIIVKQTNSSTISVTNQHTGYLPKYYIVAAMSKFGTARSTDTLIGRVYYDGISSPSISSISQGTYTTYIALTCNVYTYNNDHIEIYRSINDTNAFRLIGTAGITNSSYSSYSSYSTIYYYDSVQTSSIYYYKIHSIDKSGRCSYPSAVKSGYLQRPYAPSLSIYPYPDYIRLSWSTVSGAVKYRVYRSPINCIDSLNLLTETALVSFTDTPPTSTVYYYTVSAVASNGYEGSKSSCTQGNISVLPQPDSIVITSNYYPRHVALAWRKVTGATGYIIYRSNLSSFSDAMPIDTILNNTYNDTLPDKSLRYYRIAAFNKKGTGVLSSLYSGSTIAPTFSSYASKNDSVFLTFDKNNRVVQYLIYRSSNKIDFALIDSVFYPSYSAPLKDFNTWYYRFAIQVREGISYPSETASIFRQLSIPSNIKVTQLVNGVRIQWNKVSGADAYDIYRSTNTSANSIYRTTTDTFFIDTLPEGSSVYYYFLRSKNLVANSATSSAYQGSRLSRPTAPTSISIVGQLKAIYLSWSMPSNSSKPLGYFIYRSTDNSNFKKIDTTQLTNYSDSVKDTVRYYYRISAYNELGEGATSSIYYATLTRPTAPQNLTGTLATSKAYIRITWTPVSSITKYSIYRSLSANGTYEYLGSVSNTNIFYDSTCTVNKTYYYKAASITPDNQSILSTYTIGIRLGPPTMFGVGRNDNGIYVSWILHPYSIQYYYVYRATSLTGPYVKIDSTTQNNYTDIRGTATNYYKVSALNVAESDLSSAATLNTTSPAITLSATQGTQTDKIDLTWTAVSDAFAYRIYRAPTDSFNRSITLIAEATATTFTDIVSSDSIYYYKITALKSTGETGFSTEAVPGYRYPSTMPHPSPTVYLSKVSTGFFIGWYPPPTSVGYDKFFIYRSLSSSGPFELAGTKVITIPVYNSRSFIDTLPQKAPNTYWYYVTAVNQRGQSVPSMITSGSFPAK